MYGGNCRVCMHSQLRTEGEVSTEEAWRPGPLLQVAFVCGTPAVKCKLAYITTKIQPYNNLEAPKFHLDFQRAVPYAMDGP